jgi:ATP-dependent RNA helicase RhlE
MLFSELGLVEPILRAVSNEGYTVATPIQEQAIPHILAHHDLLGCAQTGTGKTAAFALPILQHLAADATKSHTSGQPRCLVLCPTRELATQIGQGFRTYGKNLALKQTVIFGGVNERPQIDALRRNIDIVIATPGRLLDLMNQGHAKLNHIEMLVLDEADRMLDMGFINDIRKIIAKLPGKRQTLMFSATMPPEIRQLANSLLRTPVTVQVAAPSATAEGIDQAVYFVERSNKPSLLAHLVEHLPMYRTIVFTRTKHGADRVVRHLHARGIHADSLHGNKSQNARQKALESFRANRLPVLVATDIASRGIDVDGITHVVNYDISHEPETYVHRIGRTARAGASGMAISLCDRDEVQNLRAIERLLKQAIPVTAEHPFSGQRLAAAAGNPQQHSTPNGRREDGRSQEGGGGRGHREGERREGGHREGGRRNDGHRNDGHQNGGHQVGGHRDGADRANAPRQEDRRDDNRQPSRPDNRHESRPSRQGHVQRNSPPAKPRIASADHSHSRGEHQPAARGDHRRADHTRSDHTRSEHTRADHTRGEQSRSGHPRGGNRPPGKIASAAQLASAGRGVSAGHAHPKPAHATPVPVARTPRARHPLHNQH